MPCKANAPPPGAHCQSGPRRHWDTGEAEGRGVGQLVKEMTSWENLGEDVQGLPRRSVKGAGNEANPFIEHKLGTCAKGAVFAGGSPKLAAVGQDWKAHCVEDKAPVGHGKTAVRVAKDLEGLEGGMGRVAHNRDMALPIEAEMKEEAQIPYNRFQIHPVACTGSLIHEVQAIRGGGSRQTGGRK